jgi:integrase/recombinase XerD
MEERNLSDFTIRGYLYALQYWARSMDINLTVPGKPRPACKMPYAYTRDQVYQLLQACKDIREYAVLFTSLSTGVRPHELINMDVEDVDFEHHRLYLRVRGQARKKVNVEEKVTMSRRLEDVLRQWLNNRPGSAPTSALFITVHGTRFKLHGLESLFMRVGRRAGLQIRVFPYRARHTAFTFMAEDGFSNSEIMLQSRHRDPRILDGYLHPHEDALKEKLDKQYRL